MYRGLGLQHVNLEGTTQFNLQQCLPSFPTLHWEIWHPYFLKEETEAQWGSTWTLEKLGCQMGSIWFQILAISEISSLICFISPRLSKYLSTNGVWTMSLLNADLVPFQNIYWVSATGSVLGHWGSKTSRLKTLTMQCKRQANPYFIRNIECCTRIPAVRLQWD